MGTFVDVLAVKNNLAAVCVCQTQNQIQHCGLASQNRNDLTVGNGQINVFQYGYAVIRLF